MRTVSNVGFFKVAGLVTTVGLGLDLDPDARPATDGESEADADAEVVWDGLSPSNLLTISFIEPFLTCDGLPFGGTGRPESVFVGDEPSGRVGGRAYMDFGLDMGPASRLAFDGRSSMGGKDADLVTSGDF